MSERKQIGLLIIATRKYKQFFPQLLEGVKKHFLPNHKVTIFLFCDTHIDDCIGNERVKIEQYPIPAYRFPEATLYRFKIFDEYCWRMASMDYLFYSDVDMGFIDEVGDEILGTGLTVVFHPGFYVNRDKVGCWGSNGVVRESLAWVEPGNRFWYVAGGFNGGVTECFQTMANHLHVNIQKDEINNVRAEHNDESHLNAYLKNDYNSGEILYLDSGYCMVEEEAYRKSWGIDNLKPRILALSKNHAEMRS